MALNMPGRSGFDCFRGVDVPLTAVRTALIVLTVSTVE